MSLVNMKDMVEHAYRHNYAVGAFELVSLEMLRGVMAASERCRAPVILNLDESRLDSFEFDLLASAVERAAQRACVPVAIQLTRGRDLQSVQRAINAGCNGVMAATSGRELGDNISLTAGVVEMARACGVPVEGALGYVPQAEAGAGYADPDDIVYTAVAEARGYVDRTGVDFLAVSIGTVRGRTRVKPKLNWQRLRQINEALGIPLTVYGGSGLSDSQFGRLIANGVAKISYYTVLADAAYDQLRASTRGNTKGCYSDVVRAAQEAVEQEAERCLRLSGAAGRAAEVLEQCRHWVPVEHVVTCELEGLEDGAVEAVMDEGGRVLGTIPGVREVRSGTVEREHERCHCSWLVRFCHAAVIDSYHEHPAYGEFVRRRFRQGRPVAAASNLATLSTGRGHSRESGFVWAPQAVRG